MRKGFTFIELAIVLVIIGIIMGMSLRGFGVLDAARVRSEVSKLNKFQIAVANEVQKLGPLASSRDLPAHKDDTGCYYKFIDDQLFLNSGVLADRDYYTYATPTNFNKRVRAYRLPHPSPMADIDCPQDAGATTEGMPGATLQIAASPYMACSFETILDDFLADTGSGIFADARFAAGSVAGAYTISSRSDLNNFEADSPIGFGFNCIRDNWPKIFNNTTSYVLYYYYLL